MRCELFAGRERKLFTEESLKEIPQNFDETFQLLHDWATKNNITLDDLGNSTSEAEIKRREKNKRNARTNETSKLALDYRQNVSDFFYKNKSAFEIYNRDLKIEQELGMNSTLEKLARVNLAIESINWYMGQLAPRLTRAYLGLVESENIEVHTVQNDFNGSAKVALISVEKSFPAWETILKHFPEFENECWMFLVLLDKIRKRILVDFPHVNDFVRPGFDELINH